MLCGLIKWFDPEKKFGRIITYNHGEVFVKLSQIDVPREEVAAGIPLIFEKSTGRDGREFATNCRKPVFCEDFIWCMETLTVDDELPVEMVITGHGYRGNRYRRKEVRRISLKKAVFFYLFRALQPDVTLEVIRHYFNNELAAEHLVPFGQFIEGCIMATWSRADRQSVVADLFDAFGTLADDRMIFIAWKEGSLRYLGRQYAHNASVPIDIIRKFSKQLGIADLERITQYPGGEELCRELATRQLQHKTFASSNDVRTAYRLLRWVNENEKDNLRRHLDNALSAFVAEQIQRKTSELGPVHSTSVLSAYERLKDLIPSELQDDKRSWLQEQINNAITRNATPEVKEELWLRGYNVKLNFDTIQKLFLNADTEKKLQVITKSSLDEQLLLLISLTKQEGVRAAHHLLEKHVAKLNGVWQFELIKYPLNDPAWETKKGKELVNYFYKYLKDSSTTDKLLTLFQEGILPELPTVLAEKWADIFTDEEFRRLAIFHQGNHDFLLRFFIKRIEIREVHSLLFLARLALSLLSEEQFEIFDQAFEEKVPAEAYFRLWEAGLAKKFPADFIREQLDDRTDYYHRVRTWIEKQLISEAQMIELLITYLRKQEPADSRKIFYKQYHHIRLLMSLCSQCTDEIVALKNLTYTILLWALDATEFFDFETFAARFIYFSPDDQIRLIRKLFKWKAEQKMDFTTDNLDRLTRVDADLYRLITREYPDLPVDVSTQIIIKALVSFSQNNRFLTDGDVLRIILTSAQENKKRRFRLTDYFEECLGRMTAEFEFRDTAGNISKQYFGNGNFNFVITFDYDPHLVEEVGGIPGRRWNAEHRHWTAPSSSGEQVMLFAAAHRFFCNFTNRPYNDNPHLAVLRRDDKPHGVSFCQGRLAVSPDQILNRQFWWCNNQKCFGHCETLHAPAQWEAYTLLDFCQILGFDTDETSRTGELIPKGRYYQFMALMNRFQMLLERLYCASCDEILHPVETAHFAAHNVVRFCCENARCNMYKQEIYLSHCLNGQCASIIDSRVSAKCPSGLVICERCGSCCSHTMMQRRHANLVETGGYIPEGLVTAIRNLAGHLEKAEYYCYKCRGETQETENDVFKCRQCAVVYDTRPYRLKRPHRHLRRPDFGWR